MAFWNSPKLPKLFKSQDSEGLDVVSVLCQAAANQAEAVSRWIDFGLILGSLAPFLGRKKGNRCTMLDHFPGPSFAGNPMPGMRWSCLGPASHRVLFCGDNSKNMW